MKICPKCSIEKNLDSYSKDRSRKDGCSVYCKSCLYLLNKQNKNKYSIIKRYNPVQKQREKLNKSLRKFNITKDQYNEMLTTQNNSCAICNTSFDISKKCFDHSHVNGNLRGIICFNCNISLVHVKDNVDILKSMINYLEL